MSQGKAKPVPGWISHRDPYLIVDGAAKALDFYGRVFGATERMRMPGPGGRGGPRRDQHRGFGHHARGRASRDRARADPGHMGRRP